MFERFVFLVLGLIMGVIVSYNYISVETRSSVALQQGAIETLQKLAPKCMEPFVEKRK